MSDSMSVPDHSRSTSGEEMPEDALPNSEHIPGSAVPGSAVQGSALEVFFVLLRLGCVSFGGPIAHLGYFQRELIERRRWCDQDTFAEIIALAQSLPGPASSQVGFALGILRAGWPGGLAAWLGFTLPSALLMLGLAYGGTLASGAFAGRLTHGLQLVAVAVVAQAVMTMQRSLAPDRQRIALAIAAVVVTLFAPSQLSTLIAILGGGIAGLVMFRSLDLAAPRYTFLQWPKASGVVCAVIFFGFLLLLPAAAHFTSSPIAEVLAAFYRSGALVFGGGHVVLPMLENAVVARGWVTQQTFLAGYGAAQALPGPLFTFAAFLGAAVRGSSNPLLFGLAALIGIFAPGLLAMAAVLPFWGELRRNRPIQAALRGVNAAVVGILIAALITPLWTSSVRSGLDFCFALVAFALLVVWRMQPWMVVLGVTGAYLLTSAA